MDSLPVLNYGDTPREVLSAKITEVMGDVGFLILENIPGFNEDDLRWCVDFFFSQTLEKRLECGKNKYNPKNDHMYRGYFGVNHVGSSFKEGFEMGKDLPEGDPDIQSGHPLTENTTWPYPDKDQNDSDFKRFRETMEKYYSLLYKVALDLLQMIAMGLGLAEHYFDDLYSPKTMSTLRLINYPVHDFEIPPDAYTDDGRLISTASHRDSTTLTLLTTLGYEGLQVEREGGQWLDVKTKKNTLVVNLGETLSKMTGRRVKATIHRVLAIGRVRRSVPFFLEPAYHAKVPHNIPSGGKEKEELLASQHPLEDTFEYGPWLRQYLKRFVEYNYL